MARLNEILAGRFARGLQRVFQIKGPVPVATLAPEIMPVHIIGSGVENRYLDGWNQFAWAKFLAAAAANNLAWQIRNPLNSGSIIVIESLIVSAEGATGFHVSANLGGALTDLTTAAAPYTNLDGRLGNQIKGSAALSFQSTTAAEFTLVYNTSILVAGANVQLIQTLNQELVLTPNSEVLITTSVNNIGGEVNLRWRERPIEDSESK